MSAETSVYTKTVGMENTASCENVYDSLCLSNTKPKTQKKLVRVITKKANTHN